MELSEVLNQLLEFRLKLPSQMIIDCQRFSTLFLEERKWARESDSWVVPIDEVSLDDVVEIMEELFRQTNNICSITELLDTLKLRGRLVPSPLHIPTEWEDMYEEAVKAVECIDFSGKQNYYHRMGGRIRRFE